MAFPNTADIVATTIEKRNRKVANNVLKNNAILMKLGEKGRARPISGGYTIMEELSFAENPNTAWYSGMDLISTGAADVISAATFPIKQLATAIVISGLEEIQNQGEEAKMSLIAKRVDVGYDSMANQLASGVYSDGTANGGKQIGGLQSLVVRAPTTGVVGGIDRSLWSFWRNQTQINAAITYSNVQGALNTMWASTVRGKDHLDLIVADNTVWSAYMNSLQLLQRLADPKKGSLGFVSVDFMGAEFTLDGGLGGFAPAGTCYGLNTDYLYLRPIEGRNMVSLGKREATNQDATVQLLGWAGNLTASNLSLQAYLGP